MRRLGREVPNPEEIRRRRPTHRVRQKARTPQEIRNLFRKDDESVDEDEEQISDDSTSDEDDTKPCRKELAQAPFQAELKHLEKRWTTEGVSYIIEPKEHEKVPEQKVNWYEKFVLCRTRLYDTDNLLVRRTTLEVNSPCLKEILRDVIGDKYPGESYMTSSIALDCPPHSLFHYRRELAAVAEGLDPESERARHISVLIDFINEEFRDVIADVSNLLEQGLMSYQHLWTIFRPGSFVYGVFHGQPRVYKLTGYHYNGGRSPGLQLDVEYVDFDGREFGTRDSHLLIPVFAGTAQIASLCAMPLDRHPDADAVRSRVVERGRRWEALAGQNHCQYKGVALNHLNHRFNIDGRIMVDAETHHRIMANNAFTVNSFSKAAGQKRKRSGECNETELVLRKPAKFPPLTDEQALLASHMVRGFSFTEKKFFDFLVDRISPIPWNARCFKQLVIPEAQKELVQALVAEHTARDTSDPGASAFDDIVQGKGRGLVLVLHGPPGVGKTLTAECVAEFSRRPLYTVSSGDLGTSSGVLNEKLTRTLDLKIPGYDWSGTDTSWS